MATEVLMPKLGLTMTEGTIEEWKFKDGDAVIKGDILFSVATDKLTNDVECEEDGVLLKILLPEGETAPCKSVIDWIGAAGEAAVLRGRAVACGAVVGGAAVGGAVAAADTSHKQDAVTNAYHYQQAGRKAGHPLPGLGLFTEYIVLCAVHQLLIDAGHRVKQLFLRSHTPTPSFSR